MGKTQISKDVFTEIIIRATQVLHSFVDRSAGLRKEPIRIGRVAIALQIAGVNHRLLEHIVNNLSNTQFEDGGWSDSEEAAWVAGFIERVRGKGNPAVSQAIQWLKSNRLIGGGWGRHPRDRARIPTTALVLTLLPEAGCDEDYEWISREWGKDLAGPVQLSYKAGFYLLAAPKPAIQGDSELIDRTICHLAQDQNNDGGFGPWRDHPIGSDPWSTGVVLWGFAKWIDRADPDVIERALHWLRITQLPSGYWRYHYLDEGTSYALIGAVSVMRAMASRR